MERLNLICLILMACSWGCVLSSTSSDCSNKPADVLFILDSSTSIWRKHFRKQTAFVSDVIEQFDIGPGPSQTRVGVVLFGHEVWPQFNLKDITDKAILTERVKKIRHGKGFKTETAKAINYAMNRMFTPENGSREGVTKVAIVITDGRSQAFKETEKAAKRAHENGTIMFAIGVGRRLDYNELSHIASDPDKDHLFMVDNYNALSKITTELAIKACEVTKAPVPTTTPEPTTTTTTEQPPADQKLKNCGGKPADVFFVIDASGSITRKDFNKELEFVKNVVDIFDIGHDKTRVGIMSFSNRAHPKVALDNTLSKEELKSEIGQVDHIYGGTNTADALRMLRQEGFAVDVARPRVSKVAVILTDGLSADEDLTKKEAKLTHLAGIKVFAIGIGSGVDLIEIRNIASDPDDNYVFQVDDFSSLDAIKEELAIKTCQVEPDNLSDKPSNQPVCVVKKNFDLMFTYDSSSMGPEKSKAISEFLATVILKLDLFSGFLHIGRVTDNCPSGGNFALSNRLSAADFSEIPQPSYSSLIKKVRRAGYTSEYGGRDDATRMAVLIIDSDMDGLDHDTLHEARQLSKETEVFVIGVGHNGAMENFEKHFKERNIVRIDNYENLDAAATEFLDKLCDFFDIDFRDYNIDYVVPV